MVETGAFQQCLEGHAHSYSYTYLYQEHPWDAELLCIHSALFLSLSSISPEGKSIAQPAWPAEWEAVGCPLPAAASSPLVH